jgi:uncharacterized protein involved in exopolysaccharide biosynthesis
MTVTVVRPQDEAGVDFIALAQLTWRHRRLVAVACVICTVAATVFALLATPIFKAQVVLTPARETDLGSGEGLASQLGGIASLAGVNLPEGGRQEQNSQAVLESDHLIDEFIRRNNLVPTLSPDPRKLLTEWRATQLFKRQVVVITKDQRKGVVLVKIEWKDAATAAAWANEFVALANELMRRRALDESGRIVAYLTAQLEKTTDVDMRRILYGIVENETKKLTLANGRIEYAFQVVDPAVTPEVRVSPHRTIIVLIGAGLGLFIGFMIAFVRERLAQQRLASGHS